MNPQEPSDRISRRSFGLGALGSGVVASGIATSSNADLAAAATSSSAPTQGRLNQSLCKWCYDKNLSLDELCQAAKSMGMVGIDLLTKKDFATLKSHDLVCTMVSSHKLSDGLCDPKYWDEALKILNETIEDTSAAGFRNVICFSGNARGIDRKIGLKNCAEALRKIVPVAEKKKVILNMESTMPTTCATTPRGASNSAKKSPAIILNCSTTSTICRSWKGTSFDRYKRITSTLGIITPAVILVAMRSTNPRKSITRQSLRPSRIQALMGTSRMSLSRFGMLSRASAKRSKPARFNS